MTSAPRHGINAGVDVIIMYCRGENKPVLWSRIKDIETDNPTDEQSIKHMDQNLLKTQNLCMLMRIL